MKHSIRTRIVISYIAIALLVVVMVGAIFFATLHRISAGARAALLEQIADAVAGTLERPEAELAVLAAESSIRRALDATALFNNIRIRLVDAGGRVRYESARPEAIAMNLRILEGFLERRRADDDEEIAGGFMMMREEMAERHRGMFRSQARPIVPLPVPSDRAAPGPPPGPPQGPSQATGEASGPFQAEVRRPVSIRGATWHLELMGAPGFEQDFLTPSAWVFAIAAAVALAATTGAGLWIGRQLTAPVIHLTEQARRMGEGDLSARSTVTASDEIGDLSRQFNTMADRLAESFREISRERDTLRRFAGDASHELRTPLTALSTFVDLMENLATDNGGTTPERADTQDIQEEAPTGRERLRELVTDSRDQIDRLQHLVNDLLSLTRLDGSVVELQRDTHDLTALAGAAWETLDPATRERGHLVITPSARTEGDPTTGTVGTLTCDGDRMTTALKNLFENALHARPDATITVSAERRPPAGTASVGRQEPIPATVIRVADDGPGVPEAELSRLFERFYRSPVNRSSGSGLGLSIVEGIVKLHGGTVRAYNRSDAGAAAGAAAGAKETGLVVEMTLPDDNYVATA